MNKDEILEKTLGDEIVVLAKEARLESRDKQEIHLRIADLLRQMFGSLGRSWKTPTDPSS